jgi:hypothetical protein
MCAPEVIVEAQNVTLAKRADEPIDRKHVILARRAIHFLAGVTGILITPIGQGAGLTIRTVKVGRLNAHRPTQPGHSTLPVC